MSQKTFSNIADPHINGQNDKDSLQPNLWDLFGGDGS